MRANYRSNPETHDQACRILEALCEGYVLAMLEEMDSYPDKTFPCCIKCGSFRTRNAPLTPAQAQSITETLEHGHPVSGLQRHALAGILLDHGLEPPPEYEARALAEKNLEPHAMDAAPLGSIQVRSAKQILRNRGGHTIELACYQCAMKRRGGADPGAKVIVCSTSPGTFRGAVLMSQHHSNPDKRGQIDDPVVDARPVGGCGCGGGHAPQ